MGEGPGLPSEGVGAGGNDLDGDGVAEEAETDIDGKVGG